jgi:hypothetical protein
VNRRVGRGGCGLDVLVMRPSFYILFIYLVMIVLPCSMAGGWINLPLLIEVPKSSWKFSVFVGLKWKVNRWRGGRGMDRKCIFSV